MKALMVGMFGLAIVFLSTPISPMLGAGGSAMAFAAGKSGSFNSKGERLTVHENRQRIRAMKHPASAKTKTKKGQ
jgi:hypothetical protein